MILPRPIDDSAPQSLQDLADRVFRWAREVQLYQSAQPTVEIRTFRTDDAFPQTVLCDTERVVGVARIGTVQATDGTIVANNTVGWRPSSDVEQPGVVITEAGGLTAATEYDITIAILGEREP